MGEAIKFGRGVFKEPLLPTGYVKLLYIESTGTQYIDTGVSVKAQSGYDVDFSLVSASADCGIIGGFNYGGYNHNFAAFGRKWITQYGNNEGYQFGTTDVNRHSLSQNVTSGTVSFDGTTVKTGLTYYDNADRTFRLFCYNGGEAYPTFWIGSMKLYSCQMYDNGVLVRDYVPCRNDVGVYGLYDMANKQFYTNAGSGTFTGA